MKNKIIGVCPNCGANVVEREKGWFCESNRQMSWVQHMNNLKAQAEELVMTELIYS